jgi:hypothetical protein
MKFKFEKVYCWRKNGKTYLIKGTIDGKPFIIWSAKRCELEVDFEDLAKDFTVNGNDIYL